MLLSISKASSENGITYNYFEDSVVNEASKRALSADCCVVCVVNRNLFGAVCRKFVCRKKRNSSVAGMHVSATICYTFLISSVMPSIFDFSNITHFTSEVKEAL